ncbi:hypothetical protein NHX12_006005 [Muraenolepis orangiensis]|uniref:Uncharacterized protein n=1 Tax=Muraenolepis orangiensis TaxID=630683 RepID=A0A9Q0DTY5_9TELE|nr:hypothetical protein NHX12_006005 [Muraenolepis orangiensis]
MYSDTLPHGQRRPVDHRGTGSIPATQTPNEGPSITEARALYQPPRHPTKARRSPRHGLYTSHPDTQRRPVDPRGTGSIPATQTPNEGPSLTEARALYQPPRHPTKARRSPRHGLYTSHPDTQRRPVAHRGTGSIPATQTPNEGPSLTEARALYQPPRQGSFSLSDSPPRTAFLALFVPFSFFFPPPRNIKYHVMNLAD